MLLLCPLWLGQWAVSDVVSLSDQVSQRLCGAHRRASVVLLPSSLFLSSVPPDLPAHPAWWVASELVSRRPRSHPHLCPRPPLPSSSLPALRLLVTFLAFALASFAVLHFLPVSQSVSLLHVPMMCLASLLLVRIGCVRRACAPSPSSSTAVASLAPHRGCVVVIIVPAHHFQDHQIRFVTTLRSRVSDSLAPAI